MSDINDSTYTQIDDDVLDLISKQTFKIFLQSQMHLEMRRFKERGDRLWKMIKEINNNLLEDDDREYYRTLLPIPNQHMGIEETINELMPTYTT